MGLTMAERFAIGSEIGESKEVHVHLSDLNPMQFLPYIGAS